jgi:hypothetical protein
VTIPPNTSAKLALPAIPGGHVTEDGTSVNAQQESGSFVVHIGSGSYSFEVR